MRRTQLSLVAGVSLVALGALSALADDAKPAEKTKSTAGAAGAEVTLKGVMMSNDICTRPATTKEREEQQKVPVLLTFEGTPEITAAIQEIMKDLIAGNSINYEQAKAIEEAMDKRVKYYITPGSAVDGTKSWSSKGNGGGQAEAVTGTLSEKDGKKWITPGKITPLRVAGKDGPDKFTLPKGMFEPDKPFQMSGKVPLVLKVTDTVSLKCILLPAGKFMIGDVYYVLPRWADEKPHCITLTKPFWLAECPVTQEMWDAVMKDDPSTLKDPQRPVRNVTYSNACQFCVILSEKNKRTVRLPGEAEWEWACRVGTSNPPLNGKYTSQNSGGKARGECLPVKSKQSNAWGIYDMVSGCWEMTRDEGYGPFHWDDAVDPDYTVTTPKGKISRIGKGCGTWNIDIHENCGGGKATDVDYGSSRFRVAVEATPAETAEMEKK